ncbi:hypothetical protein KBX26_02730 [Micromonospora sp. C97]|uniref:hypothetical protein n=1 Tax=Micromonospora sp. C97 TaxID=2824883 RepID=UPI001B39C7FE|nr:hypothetical protein [Micromonospora sp. C97]MBQ1028922.1 hypothetical protein [Micromonospora sp. C97]
MTDQAPERQSALLLDGNEELYVAVNAQLETANLIKSENGPGGRPYARFSTNEEFWLAVFREQLRSGSIVRLDSFAISEWFPRSPGLFHTVHGTTNREMAQDRLYPAYSHEVEALREVDPTLSVFTLAGKSAMLDGGFGCVRLRNRPTDQGLLWFMSASATGVAHEGIPIGLPDNIRAQVSDDIANQGAAFGNLVGRLLFVPTILNPLYADYTGVPQLYLLVEEFSPSLHESPLPVIASAAVSFRRARHFQNEEHSSYAAAYVPFSPGVNGDLDRRLEWLEAYVDRHGGTVITDFDEHRSRFRHAPFSLNKVANGEIDESEIMDALGGDSYWGCRHRGPSLNIAVDKLIIEQGRLNIERARIREVLVGDVFSNVGAGATIINRSTVQNALNRFTGPDMETAKALEAIIDHVGKSGNSDAAENLEGFMEEIARDRPRKARLKTFWDGLVAVLPSVAQLGDSTGKVLDLFMS